MELTTLSLAAARTRTTPALFTITDGGPEGEVIMDGATPADVMAALRKRGITDQSAATAMVAALEIPFTIATGV